MASIKLNDAELETLQGAPYIVWRLYLALRRHMDYRTGRVGEARGVSWNTLQDELYVEAGQGLKDTGKPTKARVRRAFDRLIALEAVTPLSADMRFVCSMDLADTDYSAQKKPGTNPAQTRHSKPGTGKPSADAGCEEKPGTNPAQTRHSKPGTIPVSGIREDEEKKDMAAAISCPELSAESAEQAVIQLPLSQKGATHPVCQSDVDGWAELYPGIDVLQQLRNMLGWLEANPARRKTPRGIKRFVTAWLAKAQDQGGGARSGAVVPFAGGASRQQAVEASSKQAIDAWLSMGDQA